MKWRWQISVDGASPKRRGIRQRYPDDCGPAALLTVLRYFGVSTTWNRVRSFCDSSTGPVSFDELFRVASACGLEPDAVELRTDELQISPLPTIIVLDSRSDRAHFVVVWDVFTDYIEVWDPAMGLNLISGCELRHRWKPAYALRFRG